MARILVLLALSTWGASAAGVALWQAVPLLAAGSGENSPPPAAFFPGISPTPGTPPDSHGAVGPNHIMTHVNGRCVVQDRSGNQLSSIELVSFWSSLGVTDVFDPKVLYDHYTGRFIATACAQRRSTNSGMVFGISATSDPTGLWHLWLLDADSTNQSWVDFPSIGLTADRITLSANMFTVAGDNFTGVNLWVIDKATAMDGGSFNKQLLKVSNAGGTLVPAYTYDPTIDTQYIIRTGTSNLFGTGRVQIYSIIGEMGSLSFVQNPSASLGPAWSISQPDAVQQGTLSTIETNDDRILSAVIRNGELWAVHTVALSTVLPNRTAVQWWQLSPFNGSVLGVGQIQDVDELGLFDVTRGRHYYFPSVAINDQNDVLIGFTGSGPLEYASAYYALRPGDSATDEFQEPFKYRAGQGIYGGPRWGDYSQTVVDPVDERSFWTVQQIALGNHQTANYWAQVNDPLEEDTTPPFVVGATATSSTSVQVTFSEAMADNAALIDTVNYAIRPEHNTVSITRLSPTQVSISVPEMQNGLPYVVYVNPNGPSDLAGNRVPNSGNKGSFTGLGVPPTAAITLSGASPTNANTVTFGVAFSESVGNTFTAGDVSVTGTLAAGAVATVSGGPTTFTVQVTPSNPNGEGTVGITLGSGISDLAGNFFGGGSSPSSYLLDNTAPVITVNTLLTNDTTPALTGSISETPQTATVTVGAQTVAPSYQSGGTWSVSNNALNGLADGTYNVIVTASDAAGNIGTDATTGELTIDATPPSILLLGSATEYAECGLGYTDPGVSAQDIIGGDLTAFVTVEGLPVDTSSPGTFQLRYNVLDPAGNAAATVTRDVVVEDTTAPTIQLLGTDPVLVPCGTPYADAGATASDTCQGDLSASIITGGDAVDSNVPGEYVLTYAVEDASGNQAQATRTVIVDNSDGDGDGLLACEESSLGTDPANPDSDGDGLPDGTEVSAGTNPLDDTSFLPAVYVDGASGSDETGFGTPGAPWATIAHATALVQGSSVTTITINVAEGVYTDLSPAGGALAADSYEHLLGGFEASGWTRDTRNHPTVLDASNAAGGSAAENVVVLDSVIDVVLDGLSITGADTVGGGQSEAGAILCIGVGPDVRIEDCLIFGNRAGANGSGGMVLIDASPVVERSVIAANTTEGSGGGVGMWGASYPAISCCAISGNDAAGGGGGLYVGPGSHPMITNSVVSGNAAPSWLGGGMLIESNATITNGTIAHNTSAADSGGGVALVAGESLFMNCLFAGNDAYGIARMSATAVPSLVYSLFDANAGAPYYDANDGTPLIYTSASEINAGLLGAMENVDGSAAFLFLPAGAWTAAPAYNGASNRTTLTDANAAFAPGELRGQLVALTADPSLQALVLSNTATTIEVVGDFSGEVSASDAYAIARYELDADSAAIDAGGDASAAEYGVVTTDILGTVRGFDGDGGGPASGDGSDYDIGAFERDVPAETNSITVLAPNGGETFARGQTTQISWSTTGSPGDTVRIIARKGGGSGIVSNSTPNDGTFTWQVPVYFPLGPGMYIEVSSVSNPSILDTSDNTFTIVEALPEPAITVIAPNGGESYAQGATADITWTSTALEGTNVSVFAHGAGQTVTIASSTPNDGALTWSIPAGQVAATDYTVEVRSLADPSIVDFSDAPFAVTEVLPESTLTLLAPNGGETLVQGQQFTITWSSTGNIGANVRLVARRGTGTGVIALSTPNDGSYSWQVPSSYPLGPGMYIEISSVDFPEITDTSDTTFTIGAAPPPPSITVVAPNGGETLARNSTVEILWSSTGSIGQNVRIIARRGTGSAVVANSTANDGSFTWQVPSSYPLGPGMYLEISSIDTPAILDTSDSTFTIAP